MDIVCTEDNNIVPEKLEGNANFAFRMGFPGRDGTEDSKDKTDGGEDEPCVASKRHSAERASIEKLIKGIPSDTPITKTKITGPGKMVNIFFK